MAIAGVAILLLPSVSWAQNAEIAGVVRDSSGAVLPGVTVEARSDVLPGPRLTVTGGNGDYRLPALPPGSYTVKFDLSGMQSARTSAASRRSRTRG